MLENNKKIVKRPFTKYVNIYQIDETCVYPKLLLQLYSRLFVIQHGEIAKLIEFTVADTVQAAYNNLGVIG